MTLKGDPLGLDFTLVGRNRDPGAALIGVPQLVVWGATHLGFRPAGVWVVRPGGSRRAVALRCPSAGRVFVGADDLPCGVYAVRTAYADRRHLHEHLIQVNAQGMKIIGLEDAIRWWLKD